RYVAEGLCAWTVGAGSGRLVSRFFFFKQKTAYEMAISSTLTGAVLVENGQRLGASGRFVNQQWLWFNIAAMAAAFLGGGLIEWFSPAAGPHAAAPIVAPAPGAAVVGSVILIHGHKRVINIRGFRTTLSGLLSAFHGREPW